MLPSYYGDYKMVKYLIESGADINAKDKNGWTALMFAARNGYDKIAQLLIKSGADIKAKDRDGKTALSLAKEERYNDLIRVFRKKRR